MIKFLATAVSPLNSSYLASVLSRTLMIATLFVFSAFAKAGCSDRVLINGWGGEWTPFIMGTAERPSGLDMDILDAVISKAQCKWRNTEKEVPWARHLKLIEAGQLDLATAASWTQERANYAHFTRPYRTEYVAIYILEENYERFSGLNLNQLVSHDFQLGTVRGDVHGETMGQFVYDLGTNVHVVDSSAQNLEKLQLGRIDGYIGFPPYDTIAIQRKKLPKKIVVLANSITPTGKVHFMLSKKSNDIGVLEALNQAIIELQKDGTIDQIKAKYASLFDTDFY